MIKPAVTGLSITVTAPAAANTPPPRNLGVVPTMITMVSLPSPTPSTLEVERRVLVKVAEPPLTATAPEFRSSVKSCGPVVPIFSQYTDAPLGRLVVTVKVTVPPSPIVVALGATVIVALLPETTVGTVADLLKSLSTPETTASIELAVELLTCMTSPAIKTIF
jgi:hypothetical protein